MIRKLFGSLVILLASVILGACAGGSIANPSCDPKAIDDGMGCVPYGTYNPQPASNGVSVPSATLSQGGAESSQMDSTFPGITPILQGSTIEINLGLVSDFAATGQNYNGIVPWCNEVIGMRAQGPANKVVIYWIELEPAPEYKDQNAYYQMEVDANGHTVTTNNRGLIWAIPDPNAKVARFEVNVFEVVGTNQIIGVTACPEGVYVTVIQ